MTSRLVRQIIPPLVPYITVAPGLLLFQNAWLAMFGYHAGIIAISLLARNKIPIKQACRNNKFTVLLFAALAGAGGGILLYILSPLLSIPDDIGAYVISIGLNDKTWPVFLAYFILVNPLLEEYYWRGLLAFDTRGITLNDLLFSGYHLIVLAGYIGTVWLIVVFLSLTAGAWFWRQMNRLNGGLLASTVSHIAADIAVMLTIYFVAIN